MVPPEFINFFSVSAAIGATLVGLIFVAVSIAPEHTVMDRAPVERRTTASNAFTALLNPFIVSLWALVPHMNVGLVALVASIIGLFNSLRGAWDIVKQRHGWQNVVRSAFLGLTSLLVYGYELYWALLFLIEPSQTGPLYVLTQLLIVLYILGLVRSWELLGARRYGLLAWFSPLHEVNKKASLSKSEQSKPTSERSSDEI